MAAIVRCMIALLLGYLCMTVGTAVFAFYHSVWGESYYIRNDDSTKSLLDQRGRPVLPNQLTERGFALQNGILLRAGQPIESYTDGQVTVFRPVQTSYWMQKTTVRFVALITALLMTMLIWHQQLPHRLLSYLRVELSWMRPIDLAIITSLGVGSLIKVGVIDQAAFGEVVRGLQFGVNYYVHDSLIGITGKLTIFPYNPLSLFWMQWLAVINSDLQFLGVHLRSYGLVNLSIFLAYLWLCIELVVLLKDFWKGSLRTLFLIFLLNPFGIYYTIFLAQIDVITIALLIAGSRRVIRANTNFSGLALIVLGLVFAKPQHALMLPALVIAMFAARTQAIKIRVLLLIVIVSSACLVVYSIYSHVPAFAQSLTTNPQAARIGWATWFQLFGDAVVVNRPLAFMTIIFLILTYRVQSVTEEYGLWKVSILSLAALTAWFQASYAHTFGMSILMYPAIMIMVIECDDAWRKASLWLSSILLLIGWGTGPVGDSSQLLGLSLFQTDHVKSLELGGINYPSILATVETGAYIAYGLLILMRLLIKDERA